MRSVRNFWAVMLAPLFAFLIAPVAFAHEVYVLSADEIRFAMSAPRPDFLGSMHAHLGQFLLWGGIGTVFLLGLFFISIARPLERALDPVLLRLKNYAPHVAQVTIGLALIASGYYGAIFGVELPLSASFGGAAHFVSIILMIAGVMFVVGFFPRIAALVTVALFVVLVAKYHVYMLNYATYLGEAFTIALFGGAHTVTHARIPRALTKMIEGPIHDYKFLILRVLFGISLIYASLYAKFFHGALALETVSKYNLTHIFPFDPVFLVLGAMLIEILLGVCFMIGFEIRFASLFFLVFLIMSLTFFGESVWPHLILIGTALAMFLHGYDRYTLSMRLGRRHGGEPIL